jgi:hypothetical protein
MNRPLRWMLALLAAAVGAVACGPGEDGSAGTIGSGAASAPVTTTSSLPPTTTTTPTTPATSATPAAAPLSASSRLRIDGIGPINVGMTVAQARAVAGTELSLNKEPYCDVLTAPRGPAGLSLIVTDPPAGPVDLIVVKDGPVATVSGIRVGSTEAQVLAAYPGRLRKVNPSQPVHRLIYEATDPRLADRVLVFVIDNSRVATMYAGVRNQAEADEICG